MKGCTILEFPSYLSKIILLYNAFDIILFFFNLYYKMFWIKNIIPFNLPAVADSLWMRVLPLEWQKAKICERETRIAYQVLFIIFDTSLTFPRGLRCL